MSDKLEITAEVKVDASKAEGALKNVGKVAETMASEVGASAKKAGDAVDNIGNGAEKGAEKFTRSAAQMRNEIQRSTLSIEQFGKTASQKLELKITAKGLDREQFAPYLAELKRVEQAQLDASGATSAWKASLDKFGPAAAAAFSFASVVGFVGKIVSVQREFDVLNSSLKTVTGSSEAAERELSWLKTFAKETPFGLAQATQGFVKMKALGLDPTKAALTSFGNTASAMGKDLNQMIEAVADASTGEFERLKEFGIKAGKQGDQVSLTFQGVTKTIGNSASEITKYLEDIGNSQFAGAMEERAKTLDGTIAALGDTWDELFRTVSTNNVGGFIFDSVTLANGAIEDATTILKAMGGAASDAGKGTGALATIQSGLATVFETVAVVGANVKYVLTQVGNEVGGLAAQVAQAAQFNFSGVAAIRAQMVADAQAARKEIDATTDRILNARKEQERYNSYATRNASAATDPRRIDLGGASVAAAAASTAKAVKAAVSEYDKLIQKLGTDLPKAAAEAEAAQHGYNKAQTEFLALAGSDVWAKFSGTQKRTVASLFEGKIASEQAGDAAKAHAKALKDASESAAKYIDSLNKSADGIGAQLQKLQDEEQALILSASANITLAEAIQEVEIARLRETQAQELSYGNDSAAQAIQREIDLRRDLAKSINSKDVREAGIKAAEDMRKDQQKAAEESEKYWEDALMRAFESGKGFFESLWDTIKNTLKTQVLKVTIQGVMGSLGVGAAGAANAGSGVGVSDITTAYSAYDKFVSGFSSTAASMKDIGTTIGTTIGKMTQPLVDAGFDGLANATNSLANGVLQNAELINTASDILGYAAAVYSLSEGKYATAAGQAIGTYFGGAIGSYIGGKIGGWIDDATGWGGETRSGASYITGADGKAAYKEGPSGGEIAGDSARKMFDATQSTIKNTLVALGSKSVLTGYVAGLESSKSGKGFEYAGGYIDGKGFGEFGGRSGGQFAMESQDGQQAFTDYGTQLAQSIIEALQATPDIPKTIADIINQTLGDAAVSSLSVEATTKLLDTLNAVAGTVTAFSVAIAGMPFEQLKNLSFDAAAGLIAASGGMEKLGANLGAYYTNFYSAEEQRSQSIKTINAATAGSGLDAATATAESFRALVDAAMLDTSEAGLKTTASLLAVSGSLAGIIPKAEDTSKALEDTAKAAADAAIELAKTNQGWADQLAILTGAETERSIALRDAGDDTTRALMAQVYAQEDLAAAAEAASAAVSAAAEAASAAASAAAEAASAAASAALDQAKSNTSNALAGVQRAIAAEKSRIGIIQQAAQESVNATKSLFESIKSSVQSLYESVGSTQYAAQGSAFIDNALSTAQATGYLPEQDALANAIAAAKGGLSADQFATQFEADKAALVMAGKLTKLGDLAGQQLTSQEAALQSAIDQIAALDNQLLMAQQQVDVLNGIDTSVLSVRDAIDALSAAISVQSAAAATQKALEAAASVAVMAGGGDGGGSYTGGGATANLVIDLTDDEIGRLGLNKGVIAEVAKFVQGQGVAGVTGNVSDYIKGLVQTAGNLYSTGDDATNLQKYLNDASGGAYSPSYFLSPEMTAANQARTADEAATYWDDYYNKPIVATEEQLKAWWPDRYKDDGLPSFAVGTNYVPHDMVAKIHKGEEIVPAPWNPVTSGRSGGDTSRLESLVEGLTAEVQRLQGIVAEGNASTTQLAYQFDQVTEGGNATRTVAA